MEEQEAKRDSLSSISSLKNSREQLSVLYYKLLMDEENIYFLNNKSTDKSVDRELDPINEINSENEASQPPSKLKMTSAKPHSTKRVNLAEVI